MYDHVRAAAPACHHADEQGADTTMRSRGMKSANSAAHIRFMLQLVNGAPRCEDGLDYDKSNSFLRGLAETLAVFVEYSPSGILSN